jgi:P4 family phage/plasmid primase-like protien
MENDNKIGRVSSFLEEMQKFGFKGIFLDRDLKPERDVKEINKATDEDTNLHFICKPEGSNIGILTGKLSSIIVLEISSDSLEYWTLITRELKGSIVINTPSVICDDGSINYYFKYKVGRTDNLKTEKNFLGKDIGISLQSDGGYAVYPGSKYNGKTWKWGKSPTYVKIASIPKWLLSLLPMNPKQYKAKIPVKPLETETDYLLPGAEKVITGLIYGADESICNIYCKFHDGSVKFTKGSNYIWNEKRKLWQQADFVATQLAVGRILGALFNKCLLNPNLKNHYERLKELSHNIEKKSFSANIVSYIAVDLLDNEFENMIDTSDSDSLPIKGGKLINFRTWQIRDRTKEDLFSFELKVSYLGDTHSCEHARKFFDQMFVGDSELINFAEIFLGHKLTGDNTQKTINFLYGKTNSGKTTLMGLMREILGQGQYYDTIDQKLMYEQQNKTRNPSAPNPALMVIKGKRLCVTSENNRGDELNSALTKVLTGKDPISARDVYEKQKTFVSMAKIIGLTNYIPKFDDSDDAMKGRMRVVLCLANFTSNPNGNNPRDFLKDDTFIKDLETIYLDEVFTILARGAKRFFEQGDIVYPHICLDELEKQILLNDPLELFIKEKCDTDHKEDKERKNMHRVKTSDFFNCFNIWSIGTKRPNRSELRVQMERKGYKIIPYQGYEHYTGIQFKL